MTSKINALNTFTHKNNIFKSKKWYHKDLRVFLQNVQNLCPDLARISFVENLVNRSWSFTEYNSENTTVTNYIKCITKHVLKTIPRLC